jgi:hypothetical protein
VLRWAAGHFKAEFLHLPARKTYSGRYYGRIAAVARAIDLGGSATHGQTITIIQCTTLATPIHTKGDFFDFASADLDGMAKQLDFVLDHAARTRYEGHFAIRAQFHYTHALPFSALAVAYTPRRIYSVIAPKFYLAHLMQTFVPLR